MGRHSRKSGAPAAESAPAQAPAAARPQAQPDPSYGEQYAYDAFGNDVFGNGDPFAGWPESTVSHQGYAPQDPPAAETRAGGHPQQYESGGAWGARPDSRPDYRPDSRSDFDSGSVYGDWRGVPRPRSEAPAAGAAAHAALLDTGTPAFGTPAVGFPQVVPEEVAPDPLTSTGSHRRVPGPRVLADPVVEPAGSESETESAPGSGRGRKVRTYTGMAAAAVTTVLAVVVAGQAYLDDGTDEARAGAPAATGKDRSDTAASRSDGRPTPNGGVAAPVAPSADAPAPELTYEQQMAAQLPLDPKLTGPGTFDTVPGVAKAPGKGKTVRYRVDVEQGLGLDPQLFAEAVHRTLNDDRSWGHGGTKTFERVPGGEADFVITLASPGTTGVWCAKSDLDTTVDNVSCDSARTERVMINAFRWAQGSETYGPDQMLTYRQMLINHEVGHRLGRGHVNCRTPGALAPVMQQQTKSLNIDGIQCKPNPWAFPES
ncbi:DUF3152 domain-containing protein [Streptomyces virginiae]|uniref:DUF3152 domain-containing protein n=1 Tax=Streptomyces virginiae TaxID=1961 RepID=UPI002DBFE08B|nr:DUF3152 domain-containing protein [Streptomyces sp. CMAA1738]MEC4573442.1 DUF3152 domain-containing protein [Streptomyces sp. CMAA1738]